MQEERFGVRDMAYSAWHRTASIQRFVGWEQAQLLTMIDTDAVLWLEFAHRGKEPLCLIEAAMDVGQVAKPATAITRLAKRARLPAYLVLYSRALAANPADQRWRDIRSFRVRRLWPRAEMGWRDLKPAEFAKALIRIRAWSAKRLDLEEAANEPYYEVVPDQRILFER